jgi:hypothetical protein
MLNRSSSGCDGGEENGGTTMNCISTSLYDGAVKWKMSYKTVMGSEIMVGLTVETMLS